MSSKNNKTATETETEINEDSNSNVEEKLEEQDLLPQVNIEKYK